MSAEEIAALLSGPVGSFLHPQAVAASDANREAWAAAAAASSSSDADGEAWKAFAARLLSELEQQAEVLESSCDLPKDICIVVAMFAFQSQQSTALCCSCGGRPRGRLRFLSPGDVDWGRQTECFECGQFVNNSVVLHTGLHVEVLCAETPRWFRSRGVGHDFVYSGAQAIRRPGGLLHTFQTTCIGEWVRGIRRYTLHLDRLRARGAVGLGAICRNSSSSVCPNDCHDWLPGSRPGSAGVWWAESETAALEPPLEAGHIADPLFSCTCAACAHPLRPPPTLPSSLGSPPPKEGDNVTITLDTIKHTLTIQYWTQQEQVSLSLPAPRGQLALAVSLRYAGDAVSVL